MWSCDRILESVGDKLRNRHVAFTPSPSHTSDGPVAVGRPPRGATFADAWISGFASMPAGVVLDGRHAIAVPPEDCERPATALQHVHVREPAWSVEVQDRSTRHVGSVALVDGSRRWSLPTDLLGTWHGSGP